MDNRRLGTIFNNDFNNILAAVDPARGAEAVIADYRGALEELLKGRPGVLAQNVGGPDGVNYRSQIATGFDKHFDEVAGKTWSDAEPEGARRQSEAMRQLRASDTDILQITVEECRKRGTLVVASYRMNAEDCYQNQWLLSDFERAHPEWRIPLTEKEKQQIRDAGGEPPQFAGCLDPAIPEVYEQRMAIFREVADTYDIDGIEFDWRRWHRMISNPLENYPILTKMVRETRQMLDRVASDRRRDRMLLGVRVGPSLDSEPNPFLFPGIYYDEKPTNASCRELGLDVKTWIEDELVDYVCPTLFLPSLPGLPLTQEFAELAKGTSVGIYPTVFPLASWMHGVCERTVTLDDKDRKALALYKHDLCATVLKAYADGADGISTFNWCSHLRDARVPHLWCDESGASNEGSDAVQTHIYPLMGDRKAVENYLRQPWAVPPK